MPGKIMIGYGSDTRPRSPKNAYGGRTGGKKLINGGFNNCPTVSFETVTDEQWNKIFDKSFLPKWKRDLLEAGETI